MLEKTLSSSVIQVDITLRTPETPVKIKRFSEEQKETLGFVVHELIGESVKSLKKQGRKFWPTRYKGYLMFEDLSSMHSEVAINPNQLFLPNSNNKTLPQQEKMVEEFAQELKNEVPGVEVIIGEAPDYIELAFRHLDATEGKEYLFGKEYNYGYTRTKTLTVKSFSVCVGSFRVRGLGVSSWGRRSLDSNPLYLPSDSARQQCMSVATANCRLNTGVLE